MHVVVGIPCLLRGGTEMQTLQQVRALVSVGYRVTVCCYFETDTSVVSECRAAGAEVEILGLPRSISSLRLVLVLAKAFRSFGSEVVHVQYMAPGLFPVIAARLACARNLLATVHYPATPYGLKARVLLRFASRLCRHFICVSEAAERSWFGTSCLLDPEQPRSLRSKHFTIPNAVRMDCVAQAISAINASSIRRSLGLNGHPVLGTVARLSREKGVDVLLKAFARVQEAFPEARLLVVGDGSQRQFLHELARSLGVSAAVVWTGQQHWEKAIQFLSIMDIFVVPSRFEGFGLTTVEAMACGKPVIATMVDGLPEVLGGVQAGFLVPPDEPKALADSCLSLLRNPALRAEMGAWGKERVKALYDISAFNERYQTLYRTLQHEPLSEKF